MRFIRVCERKQGKTRQAAMVAAQIHGMLDAGDAAFRDDNFGREGQVLLQSLSGGVLAALEEFEQFDTFFR
jgi:hypothetical protein